MLNKTKNQILTPNQVAEMMMVSPATVRQWAAKGILKALTTPGGHRRFRMSDISLFAQQQGLILNIEEKESAAILIVDDDKQFASYLEALLLEFDANIAVRLAHDGFEAGKLITSFQPDLILMDLMMPMMDGFETCKSIKADPETAKIRIISMTGYASEENVSRILALGAEDCLIKPIDEELLGRYVSSILIK